jgi:ubiquinone/menaquinone biosynthesis C-methylase UbiE
MIAHARRLNAGRENLDWVHNPQRGLPDIDDASIDFIYTRLVLQHISTAAALGYLSEFARVLAPHGLLVFQYPCGNLEQQSKPDPIRKVLRRIRTILRPPPPRPLIMEMHGHPLPGVIDHLQRSGLRVHAILDDSGSAPPDEAYMYIVGRPDRRTTTMPFIRA